MTPRPPTELLVVGANIILSIALGVRSRPVFETVAERHRRLTSERARQEVFGTAGDPRIGAARTVEIDDELLEIISVVDAALCAERVATASDAMRSAVASRNGSTSDAHLLALGWTLDAAIRRQDRDLANTGSPTCRTPIYSPPSRPRAERPTPASRRSPG